MDMIDQIAIALVGVAGVAALVGIPYLRYASRRIDQERAQQHPAE